MLQEEHRRKKKDEEARRGMVGSKADGKSGGMVDKTCERGDARTAIGAGGGEVRLQ